MRVNKRHPILLAVLVSGVLAGFTEFPLGLASTDAIRFVSKPAGPPGGRQVSAIDAQHVWVGLAHSGDGGRSWVAHIPPANIVGQFDDIASDLQSTFFVTDRRGWLVGTDAVWATMDGGISWSKQFEGHIHALGFTEKGAGWMGVGDERGVRNFVTTDSGLTWSRCGDEWKPSVEAPLNSVSLLDSKVGWITVAKYDEIERPILSGVARTEDGGCTWKTVWWNRAPDQENFGEIQFIDSSFGWLLPAGHGKLRQTSDGGLTWRELKLPAADFYFESGRLLDPYHAWVLGNSRAMNETDSGIFYSADIGEHWQAISKSDLRANRGRARQLPPTWGDGLLTKFQVLHARP